MANNNEECPTKEALAEEVCKRLSQQIQNPRSELNYNSDYAFLLAVVMSAQTTDVQVNRVTKDLFKECPTIDDILQLGEEKLREKIKSIGFYKNKAKNIIGLSKILKEKYDKKVPNTREALESLPGVGRKSANVVLNTLFGEDTIAVDTHVLRLSKRFGLSRSDDPIKVEADLEKVIPNRYKHDVSNLFILHGRYVCKAQRPLCDNCILRDICRTYNEQAKEKC